MGLLLSLVGAAGTWGNSRRTGDLRRSVAVRLGSETAQVQSWWRRLVRTGSETGAAITLPSEARALERLLITAGVPHGLTLSDLSGIRAFLVTAALLPTMLSAYLFGLGLFSPIPTALAYAAPHLWLRYRASARQFQIGLQLPDFLDLMATALQAGGSFQATLGKIADRFGGPVGEVMFGLYRKMMLGSPFDEACRHSADQNSAPELQTFLRTLQRAHACGVPLAQGLCQYARDIRTERRHQVRKQAAMVEHRLSLVSFLLIFPACLLLIVGLVVLNLVQNPIFSGWQ